ncbi:hypothetical protein F5050DRAFT_1802828 [Lentinula boryana]|uniref:Uncharacterized protein n=1 Tax=Lentinula boryana TaxID=40481 RepID=A0ABQ8QUD2_9AGAR|nr:hypothetical protein F5050DRAFT_1802828 [Lentinula boryana]
MHHSMSWAGSFPLEKCCNFSVNPLRARWKITITTKFSQVNGWNTNEIQRPPELEYWEYLEDRSPECHDKDYEEAYMIIRLAMNSLEELKVLKEHRQEVVHTACEALGLPSEDLRWYRTVL